MGIQDFTQSLFITDTHKSLSFEPYSTYLEENVTASSISNLILSNEMYKSNILPFLLKFLSIISSFNENFKKCEELMISINGEVLRNISSGAQSVLPIGTQFGFMKLMNSAGEFNELKIFLLSQSFQGMFASYHGLYERLSVKCKEVILAYMLVQPAKSLSVYHSENDIWEKTIKGDRHSEALGDVLPHSLITAVGEHMLSFVTDFENYAQNSHSVLFACSVEGSLVQQSGGWKDVQERLGVSDEKVMEMVCSR